MSETIKPDLLEECHLVFLDELRKSEITNMFGAGSYLQEEFGLGMSESNKIVGYWMRTFSGG